MNSPALNAFVQQKLRCNRGQIQLIFGPMFSGKTTELLRRVNRYKIAKYKVLVIKYAMDCRYDEECVSTHDKHAVPAKKAVVLKDLGEEWSAFDVIGIDEGQFFPDILEFAEKLANAGKTVIVAALDGTYQRQAFGSILELVPKSENITKLSAVCIVCNEDAAFTRRHTSETTVELIGGSEKYLAVCRECHQNDLPREFGKLSDAEVKIMCSPIKRDDAENRTGFVIPMRQF